MATCKHCGRPLILKDGKCLRCGKGPNEQITPRNGGNTSWAGLPPVRTFNINGVSFNMILVEGGTMWIGEQNTDLKKPNYDLEADGHNPLRKVSVDTFYIAETLVTLGLVKALYRDNRPYRDEDGECETTPVAWFREDTVSEFAAQTGEYFRSPTPEEWEFAARGGMRSKGYRFSGSNILNEVGWYHNNLKDFVNSIGLPFTAENARRCIPPIKMKKKNELGIYDMSGLLYEPCEIKDKGHSRFAIRGGYYLNEAKYCRIAQYSESHAGDGACGIRLAMTPQYERAKQ